MRDFYLCTKFSVQQQKNEFYECEHRRQIN